ncbi:MAG: 3-oxoadipyl-CoA thiolase [Pseudomonadota bacterium]|nr:3-oxoadipyl-CoA thiolase [Pseudomonadota bacterium]
MDAFICDAVRTPIGRFGGNLASMRPDDMAAHVIRGLMARHPSVDPNGIDEVIFGCANQAGEDNRNVARMASLLAGLPAEVPASTINRLCASGMDAVILAGRGINAGDYQLAIAGGVESMSRAPLVMSKADHAFSRGQQVFDTTIGWRFVNPAMQAMHGVDSMSETAENVAVEYTVSRQDQDAFSWQSQKRCAVADQAGVFADEILPVEIEQRQGGQLIIDHDEHPRPDTSLEKLAKLPGLNGPQSTVTAGNSSGINDGAAALLLASKAALSSHGLVSLARIVASATAGVPPHIMGMGPVPASQKALAKAGVTINDMDVIEINEAFAAQALACLRTLGIGDDEPHVNPNGGAIALGHPLGMSGARLVLTAAYELKRRGGRYALCTMCIGVGQGMALILEAC